MTWRWSLPNLPGDVSWTNAILGVWFIVAALIVGGAVAIRLALPRITQTAVERYTDPAPRSVKVVTQPDDVREKANNRIDAFMSEHAEPEPAASTLVLTEAELNALVQDGLKRGEFEDAVALRIEEGAVLADVSLPLKNNVTVGWWKPQLAGRYLNGTATLSLALQDGSLEIDITAFAIDGEPIPEWPLNLARTQLDRAGAFDSEDLREFARHVHHFEIVGGTIIFYKQPVTAPAPVEVATDE